MKTLIWMMTDECGIYGAESKADRRKIEAPLKKVRTVERS